MLLLTSHGTKCAVPRAVRQARPESLFTSPSSCTSCCHACMKHTSHAARLVADRTVPSLADEGLCKPSR
eukprot:2649481-Rhodomonas_salina.1